MFGFRALIAILVLIQLLGCSESDQSSASLDEPISEEQSSLSGSSLVSESLNSAHQTSIDPTSNYGYMTKNSVTMPFKDKLTIWDEQNKKLKVFLSPEAFTKEETERLTNGDEPFFVLVDKASPNERVWQWFPYAVMEFRFKTSDVNTENLTSIYVMGYGLDAQNHTDNINTRQDKKNVFSTLTMNKGTVTMSYSGSETINDNQYSWTLEF